MPGLKKHQFIASTTSVYKEGLPVCVVTGCGRAFEDEIHEVLAFDVASHYPPFGPQPIDKLFEVFPTLLVEILRMKSLETKRSDISNIVVALIRSGFSPDVATTVAIEQYERIEQSISEGGKK